ncbi:diacylglycerol/lipid kinase family protein [Ornithinimicrobium sp. Y1694]|uniref:diacylglycerol/lipid kinase family protein n=1 Tax=Ornithinimicrobium sp. Y1694 TaxID=3418590 RepID=UPI003CFB7AB4
MRYAVAHGRRSGRGGAAVLGAAAVSVLRRADHEVVEVETDSLDEARDRCTELLADGLDALVVAGGDGAVSLATDLCAGSSTAVGILPAGTGNDAARSLRIPTRPDDALRVLVTGHRRTLDTIRVRGEGDVRGAGIDRHVLGSVNAGLDARIAHRATLLPRRLGAATYTLAALVEIARLRWTPELRYHLTLVHPDGATTDEELTALVLAPANLPFLGGGLHLAPQADPQDGLLDLVTIGPLSPTRALVLLRAVRAGRHTGMTEVSVRRVREVRIAGPADVLAHGDGEELAPLPLTISAVPRNLQVIAPPLA